MDRQPQLITILGKQFSYSTAHEFVLIIDNGVWSKCATDEKGLLRYQREGGVGRLEIRDSLTVAVPAFCILLSPCTKLCGFTPHVVDGLSLSLSLSLSLRWSSLRSAPPER